MVNGKGGISNAYTFTDNSSISKINYYRLRQVDIDNRGYYSKILVLRSDLGQKSIKATPNPFNSFFNLSYQLQKDETINIRLFDQMGRLVKSQTTRGNAGINTVNISDLDRLPAGNYTIELRGDTVSFKQQLIKQ